jgi:hypothetical protein
MPTDRYYIVEKTSTAYTTAAGVDIPFLQWIGPFDSLSGATDHLVDMCGVDKGGYVPVGHYSIVEVPGHV